ncbi:MAG: TPM domain-containing protein [Verrucomicrobiota bacterium]
MTLRHLLLTLLLLAGVGMVSRGVCAEESLPTTPRQYVTDEAGVITPAVVAQLNQRLAAFEKATSNQIVAVVYPKLPEGASLEDYAQRLYSSWKIGSKKNSNGVLILIFVENKKGWIQTGYGMEGALPDVVCSRIIREIMSPAFRAGNYNACLTGAITAVVKATKGEYKGTGKGKPTTLKDLLFSPLGFFLLIMMVLIVINRNRRDIGTGGGISPGAAAATGFFLGGAGGWGGGSGGGGDSGGFSGGGGESGGGGGGGDL